MKYYKYDELTAATGNWSQNNELGKGGFGTVYRAVLGGECRTTTAEAVALVSVFIACGVLRRLIGRSDISLQLFSVCVQGRLSP